MFHVPCFRWQSDQVTGHWTDYLLSLYTRSVTIGTMVIIDTIQVVNRGGEVITFFLSIITIYSLMTLWWSLMTLWCQNPHAHDTNPFIEAWRGFGLAGMLHICSGTAQAGVYILHLWLQSWHLPS